MVTLPSIYRHMYIFIYSKESERTKYMIFTIPILVAFGIAIVACFLVLEPESLSKTSLEDKIMRN
jgi:hypothetical protein